MSWISISALPSASLLARTMVLPPERSSRAGLPGQRRRADPAQALAAGQAGVDVEIAATARVAASSPPRARWLLRCARIPSRHFLPSSSWHQDANEHVRQAVGIARHQVAGLRDEGDEPPVRRDRRLTLKPLPWTPPGPTLTRRVVPVLRSRTNTSARRWCRPAPGCWRPTRRRRSARPPRSPGRSLLAVALGAARARRSPARVVPVWRSRTNTSAAPLVSPGTRLVAYESKATNRPSAEIAAPELTPLPWTPPGPTLTRWVVPVWRSRTNTSRHAVGVARHQVGGVRSKATNRPSAEIARARSC